MPPLWVIGAEGGAELVNYRVQGNHMIVDRLFAAAELRLGGEQPEESAYRPNRWKAAVVTNAPPETAVPTEGPRRPPQDMRLRPRRPR